LGNTGYFGNVGDGIASGIPLDGSAGAAVLKGGGGFWKQRHGGQDGVKNRFSKPARLPPGKNQGKKSAERSYKCLFYLIGFCIRPFSRSHNNMMYIFVLSRSMPKGFFVFRAPGQKSLPLS
jgi:hypothetical protein